MAASKQKKDDPFVVTFEERGDQTIVRKSNDLVQMTAQQPDAEPAAPDAAYFFDD